MSHWTVLLYVTRQSRLLQLGCYKQYGSTVSSGVGPHHMRAVKRFREHLESSCNTIAFCAVEQALICVRGSVCTLYNQVKLLDQHQFVRTMSADVYLLLVHDLAR